VKLMEKQRAAEEAKSAAGGSVLPT
jgi:hypothetical protein